MKIVYPVIHFKDNDTTIKEARLAYECGADGVFLISHIGNDLNLIPLANKIKKEIPFKVGLNLLGMNVNFTAKMVQENGLDMVWGDSCGVSSIGITSEGQQLTNFAKLNHQIEIFASVAFKYQRPEKEPVLAAINALNCGFIPTTSGSGTGYAPEVEKISSMSNGVNGLLAVASGMTVENIDNFKTYLSHVLIATGVSKDEYHFDPDKLKAFIEKFKK